MQWSKVCRYQGVIRIGKSKKDEPCNGKKETEQKDKQ